MANKQYHLKNAATFLKGIIDRYENNIEPERLEAKTRIREVVDGAAGRNMPLLSPGEDCQIVECSTYLQRTAPLEQEYLQVKEFYPTIEELSKHQEPQEMPEPSLWEKIKVWYETV